MLQASYSPPPFAQRTETFSSSIKLDYPSIQTVPPNSGDLILSVDPAAIQTDGVTKYILIPAGNATGLNAASLAALNIVGDPFDPTHDILVSVGKISGRFFGTIRDLGLVDSTAPTFTEVRVNQVTSPTVATITTSEPVVMPDLSSLGLSFTSGTPRTIESLTSGNGSSEIVLALSGPMSGSDVASLVISSSNIQDFVGNIVADTSVPITFATEYSDLASCVIDWTASAANVTLSGSNVLAAIDRSSLANTIHGGGTNHYPTYISSDSDGTPSIQFTGASGNEQYLKIDATPIDPTLDFTVCMLLECQTAPAGYNGLFSIDDSGGNGVSMYQRDDLSQGHLGAAVSSPDLIFANGSFGHTWHFLIFYRHNNKWGVRIDLGSAVEADWNVYPILTLPTTPLGIGAWLYGNTVHIASASKLKSIGAWSRYLSTDEQTAVRGFTRAKFAVCP